MKSVGPGPLTERTKLIVVEIHQKDTRITYLIVVSLNLNRPYSPGKGQYLQLTWHTLGSPLYPERPFGFLGVLNVTYEELNLQSRKTLSFAKRYHQTKELPYPPRPNTLRPFDRLLADTKFGRLVKGPYNNQYP